MRRREAVRIFREFYECTPDADVRWVSITPTTRSKEEFELRLSASLDVESLKNIQAIVNEHGVILKEDHESLLVYSDTKPIEIRKKYEIIGMQSLDGDVHIILGEPKLYDTPLNRSELDETQIKEIMKGEAQKPLRLARVE